MSIQSTILPNGLRVVTDTVETVESIAVGIWADVGARHENMKHNGIAHMVEHMMFNGTPTRTAQDIVQQIEGVGGQMNAYTSREMTAYYIHLLKEDITLALDILADIIQRPIFPDHELEKERGVIIQEIGMTNDTPDDLVFDLYQKTAYPEQALGAPILGTAEIVQAMPKQALFEYVQNFYTPERLVISAAGNVSHDEIVSLVERLFTELPSSSSHEMQKASYQGGYSYNEKELEQSHVVLGFQGVDRAHEDYYTTMLLATIFGGGMSSRLFQTVREKHGLAYSVYASHSAYADDGQFEIYTGTGPDKLSKLIPVLCDEIQKIMRTEVMDDELKRAKSQLCAGILMGRESMLARANRQAKYMINFDKCVDIQHIINEIENVNIAQIKQVAQRIFSEKPTVAALGPLKNLESYDQIRARLSSF